ncbi:hypothetical protein MTR_2g060600 [Medicago truncatula]|uniref:Uncharacterized protein n=1 Tax=Medicago truncatula TaxID=3880 RepID=G7IIZ1_MEDTR|nr:hypothetical protein MTR_2g060600 [Medicago truncatula]
MDILSYFSEIFHAFSFWLDLPSFEKLINNDVLYESTCISREEANGHVPWIPEFVPKIGLELIEILAFGLFRDKIQKDFDTEMSLASTCCLNGMINIITEIDNLIRSAKT